MKRKSSRSSRSEQPQIKGPTDGPSSTPPMVDAQLPVTIPCTTLARAQKFYDQWYDVFGDG